MPAGFGPIPGLKIGHAQDGAALTGCTVFVVGEAAAAGMVAACEVRGGAVGERELNVLDPGHIAERIHGLVFAGGSAFGLDAASGVVHWLEERGIGFDTGVTGEGASQTLSERAIRERAIRVPIVPAAILFDLGVAAKSGSSARRPDAAMGYAAAQAAVESPVAEGNTGAGTGCSVGKLFGMERAMKAGIGCWTERLQTASASKEAVSVAALAAVNAFGDIRDPGTGRLLAGTRIEIAPEAAVEADSFSYELLDTALAMRQGSVRRDFAGSNPAAPRGTNTVLVAVATDAALTRIEAKRVAAMAAAGMARAISPAHTTFDGDIVFVLSLGSAQADVNAVGAAAADAVAKAIVRGVTQAQSAGGLPGLLQG